MDCLEINTLAYALRAETQRIVDEEKRKDNEADILVSQIKLAIMAALDDRESPLCILLWDFARRKNRKCTLSLLAPALGMIHGMVNELVVSKMMHRLHLSRIVHSGVMMTSVGDGMSVEFDWQKR